MMFLFWFDHVDPDDRKDELALHASRFQDRAWNGFHVPVVTAAEFVRFITAWAVEDPNGDWGQTSIDADDELLTVRWGCGHVDMFVAFDGPKGNPVYGIDGFCWTEPDEVSLVFNSEHHTVGVRWRP